MVSLVDRWIKRPVFGCMECGQCLLSQTGYICPMNCPKGLRNGPCGGTVDGKCEVLPDQACVWTKIHTKISDNPVLLGPFEQQLVGTSSVANFLSGKDRISRKPRTLPDTQRQADSDLAKRLRAGQPVITLEVASPREPSGLAKIERYLEPFKGAVDAVNTTSGAAGKPSLHSLTTAQVVRQAGFEAIVQFCGRDHTPAQLSELLDDAVEQGHQNFLMLTGDWNPDQSEINHAGWFPMDSLQMVDLAAGRHPAAHIGVASHPQEASPEISNNRLMAKARAGAQFTQTQVVTNSDGFGRWLAGFRDSHPSDLPVLASIPLVGRATPWAILQALPGVRVSPVFARHLNLSSDIEKTGLELTRHLARDLWVLGVDGVHLMNFGASAGAVAEFAHEMRELFQQRAA